MELVLIASIGNNYVIGQNDQLAWRHTEDMKRFRELTIGHPVLMGRKTFESIGRPLPERENVVVTGRNDFSASGVIVAHSLRDALRYCDEFPVATFCIGGEQLYRTTMPLASKLEITEVHGALVGNKYFPQINPQQWRETNRVMHPSQEFSFVTHTRA
jgi:dihydrofolate reductase